MSAFIHQHADYLTQFNSIQKYESKVRAVCRFIREENIDFSHIAVCGVSGITIGGPVALRLKKNLIVVRKDVKLGLDCHSGIRCEGIPKQPFNYIIIDDCVDTGKTITYIDDQIYQRNAKSNLVSVILYYYSKIENCSSFKYIIERNGGQRYP